MEFAGRVAVVTGGASGIGAACARELEQRGATPVSWDVGGEPDIFCDVSDPASIDAALRETIERFGPPSILVASAGVGGPVAPIHQYPVDGWDRVVSINLRGVFLSIRAVAASMVEAGLDGALVAISSVNGRIADPGQVAYSSTKAALYHLCRVAALDLGPYGIRVNGIGPGPTSTPMLRTLVETEGYVEEVTSVTPLGRLGTPELVAQSVANVIASDWITGQEIMVDGGSSLATARGAKRIAKMMEMERLR